MILIGTDIDIDRTGMFPVHLPTDHGLIKSIFIRAMDLDK